MLTDGAWMNLEPLIEACRPKGKTPPQDLRRTLSTWHRTQRVGQLGAGDAKGIAASSYYDLIASHRDSEFGAGHGWQRLSGRLDGKGEWAGGAHSHSWSQ